MRWAEFSALPWSVQLITNQENIICSWLTLAVRIESQPPPLVFLYKLGEKL